MKRNYVSSVHYIHVHVQCTCMHDYWLMMYSIQCIYCEYHKFYQQLQGTNVHHTCMYVYVLMYICTCMYNTCTCTVYM